MKIVAISDTHGNEIEIPPCDLLIHAGDLTMSGSQDEVERAIGWLLGLKEKGACQAVVIVPGNHDFFLQDQSVTLHGDNVWLLRDAGCEFEGVSIWGSPFTPAFFDWAFMEKGNDIQKHWDLIPAGLDILITHGPPFGTLDQNPQGMHCGCPHLAEALKRIQPKAHIFGHIHHSHGSTWDGKSHNVSICDEGYRPTRSPLELEIAPSSYSNKL